MKAIDNLRTCLSKSKLNNPYFVISLELQGVGFSIFNHLDGKT